MNFLFYKFGFKNYFFYRLNTDSSNWYWNDETSVTYNNLQRKVFSKHGSSFVNSKTNDVQPLLLFCFDEIRCITDNVSYFF